MKSITIELLSTLKNSTLVLLMAHILFSCSSPPEAEKDSSTPVLVDNSAMADTLDISDYIDTLEIIQLKETKGNYLGYIDKFFRVNDHYVAADLYQTDKANLFDRNGNFVKTLIRQGQGPNEVMQINDCWVNDNEEVEIYDFGLKKIFQFDSLFSVRKVVKAKDFCMFFALRNIPRSSLYMGYAGFNGMDPSSSGLPFQIAVLDDNLKVISRHLPYKDEYVRILMLTFREHFYKYGDSLRFIKAYDNYVYDVQPSGLSKRYKIIYSDNATPEDILDEAVADHLDVFKDGNIHPRERDKYLGFTAMNGTWLETDKMAYFTSTTGNKFRFVSILDKKGMTTKSAKMLVDKSKYKMTLPYFKLYDPKHNAFSGLVDGSTLRKSLSPNSDLYKKVIDDPAIQYIVNVRFNL